MGIGVEQFIPQGGTIKLPVRCRDVGQLGKGFVGRGGCSIFEKQG